MQQYHDLLQHIMDNGAVKTDRTGTGTKVYLVTKCVLTFKKVFRW
jgi:thymidylate synthase